MASTVHIRASEQNYHRNSNQEAVFQSMVAEFSLANGDAATAIHNYTVLAIRGNSTAIKQRAFNIALQHDDLQASLNIAKHWVLQEPKDVPAKFYLAHIALKSHNYELAANTLDQLLSIDPDADLEQIIAGIAPDSAEDRENLLRTLRSSQKKNNPSILILIAGLEAQNQQFDLALKNVNKALRKRPAVTGFILLKANILMAMNDSTAALAWFEKCSKKYPKNADIRLAHIRHLIKIDQTDIAFQQLEDLLQHPPYSDKALLLAGLTAIDLKKYNQAEQYLVELRHSNQFQNDAYFYLAVNAERKNQDETAKAYYRLVDGNLYTVSRRNLISIYARQNQLNDALRFLTQERVNYPQYASFLYQAQAEILKKQGNNKAALSLLNEAVKNLPDDPEILYSQVLLLDPFQNRQQLDAALKHLLEIEPNSPTYLNAYAYTLAMQNRRLNDARDYAERALALAPEQASILDTLGYIAFLQNDFKTAAQVLAKAYDMSHSLNIGIRYAKALYMQGDLDDFNQILTQLKQNHAQDPQLEQLNLLVLPSQHP